MPAYEIRVVAADLRQPEVYCAELAACDVFISTVLDHADPVGTDRRLFEVLRDLPEKAGGQRLFIYTTGCFIYGKVPEQLMDETTPGNPAHHLYFRMEAALLRRFLGPARCHFPERAGRVSAHLHPPRQDAHGLPLLRRHHGGQGS